MKTLFTLLMLMTGHAFGTAISDPIKYSNNVAKEYSKGDLNKIGEYRCQYNHNEEQEVGGDIRIVDCEGITSILVHGGYMEKGVFDCRMTFEPMPNYGRGYQVTYESCQ